MCALFRCSLFLLDNTKNNLVATVFNGDVLKVCVCVFVYMCMCVCVFYVHNGPCML